MRHRRTDINVVRARGWSFEVAGAQPPNINTKTRYHQLEAHMSFMEVGMASLAPNILQFPSDLYPSVWRLDFRPDLPNVILHAPISSEHATPVAPSCLSFCFSALNPAIETSIKAHCYT